MTDQSFKHLKPKRQFPEIYRAEVASAKQFLLSQNPANQIQTNQIRLRNSRDEKVSKDYDSHGRA